VSHRTRNIVLIVLASLVVIWIVGYTLFNVGGKIPGSGEGDPVSGMSTTP
jgi:hypothetical protein